MPNYGNFITNILNPLVKKATGLKDKILKRSLEVTSGMVSDYDNPDKLIKKKSTTLELYDTMLLDDVIKSRLELKKKIVLSTPYKIQPASDEDSDIEIAKFVTNVINDMEMPFVNYLDNLLDSIAYGFKIGEIYWEIKDGKWCWNKFRFMHSSFFDFKYDEYGNMTDVLIGYRYGSEESIPREQFEQKFIYMIYPYLKDENWYGDSELREIYNEWWQKFNLVRWRGVYLQGFAMRVPVIKYDFKTVNQDQLNEIDEMFDNWQDLMRVKIPSVRDPNSGELRGKFEIDWREIGTQGGAQQFNETIEQINREISRKMLIPDKMGYSSDDTGSYSQSKVMFDMFIILMRDIQTRLEEVINSNIVQLIDFNFPAVEEYPKFQFDDITKKMEVGMLNLLIQSGVVDKREKWIRSYANIPDITEEEQEAIDEAKQEDIKQNQQMIGVQPKTESINGQETPEEKPIDESGEEEQEEESFKNPFGKEEAKVLDEELQRLEDEFLAEYNRIMNEQEVRLIEQLQKKEIDKDYKAIDSLRIKKNELKKLFATYYAKLYFYGKKDALNEITVRGKIPVVNKFQMDDGIDWLDRKWIDEYLSIYGDLSTLSKKDKEYLLTLRDRAYFVTGETEEKILKIIQNNVYDTIKTGKPLSTAIVSIRENLAEDRRQYATTIARTGASDYYNTGRMNMFTNPAISGFIPAYQYNATMDAQTTPFCRQHNGQIIKPSDPMFPLINPPNHFNALLKGTMIKTKDGEKAIEEIKKGDLVYTHTGKLQKVYDTMFEDRNEDIYEIELSNGKILRVTGEHPILTNSWKWKNAEDLKVNEKLRGEPVRLMRYCKVCGKELLLKGKKKNYNYCDQKCMAEGYRKYTDKVCLQCGTPLIGKWKTKKSVYNGRRYCSRECYLKYKGRTSIEQKFYNILTKLGANFIEQFKIGKYVVDFMLPDKKIVFEVDGNYWHTIKERWATRYKKDKLICESGYKLYRIGQDRFIDELLEKDIAEVVNG